MIYRQWNWEQKDWPNFTDDKEGTDDIENEYLNHDSLQSSLLKEF